MKFHRIILVVFVTLTASLQAQSPSELRSLDSAFAAAVTAWGVPGMAVAIVRNDTILLARGYGVRTLGSNDPVDEHTLFAIASNTKAFTAALLAALVNDGTITWNDRVQQYLPYFQLYDPYVSADVRIRDLLSHRVGLRTFGGDLVWYGTSYSSEEVVRRARYLKQAYPFRSGYGYSNIMYVAAGEVVEKASGMTWKEALTKKILRPLGMTHTVLSVKDLKSQTNVATPHGEENGIVRAYPWYVWDNVAPAGGIISCVADLAQWMRLQLARGQWDSTHIWSTMESRLMWTPQMSFAVGGSGPWSPHTNFRGYGLGWSLSDYRGHMITEHGGGYDGMFSQTVLIPDLKLGVVVLTNSMTGIAGAATMQVVDVALGIADRDRLADGVRQQKESRERQRLRRLSEDSTRISGTKPSRPLTAYTGTFGGPLYGDATVTVESGRLVLRLLPNPDLVADLTHWHYDVFELTWRKSFPWFGKGKVQFIMNDRAEVTELKLNVPNNDFWFDEPEFKKKK